MIHLHPAFDGLWYVETPDGVTVEAPTLRALTEVLLTRITGRFKLTGYNPKHQKKITFKRDKPLLLLPLKRLASDRDMEAAAERAIKPVTPLLPITKTKSVRPFRREVDRNHVLDLWAKSHRTKIGIAEIFKCSTATVILILTEARKRGDPRARRQEKKKANVNWTDELIAAIKRMATEQRTTAEMERITGVTRNAIIGKCRRLGIDISTHKKQCLSG